MKIRTGNFVKWDKQDAGEEEQCEFKRIESEHVQPTGINS